MEKNRSCCLQSATNPLLEIAAQLRGYVDELETLIASVEDTHTIGNVGHEDDHAVGSRSRTSELEIAAQLRGYVDELETLIARLEYTHTLSAPSGTEIIVPLAAGAAPANLRSLLSCAKMPMSWKL